MPTTTTTETVTAGGGTTTTTTTTATADPAASAPPSAHVAAAREPVRDERLPERLKWPTSAVPIPNDGDDITAAWVQAVLAENNSLPAGTSIASIEKKQIGIGRGFIGFTFLISVVYDQPVNSDVKSKFVVKIPNCNLHAEDIFEPYFVAWLNELYATENTFFECMRDRVPVQLPKGFGSGGALPEVGENKIGKFWIMMEDCSGPGGVIEYDQADGVEEYAVAEAVATAIAKLSGAFFNRTIVGDAVSGLLPGESPPRATPVRTQHTAASPPCPSPPPPALL